MKRGELWWASLDKRRPVVLLSRDEAYAVRALVTVAPVSTRIRGFAAEVRLGRREGLSKACVANLDAVVTIPQRALLERIRSLSTHKIEEINEALRFTLGLD